MFLPSSPVLLIIYENILLFYFGKSQVRSEYSNKNLFKPLIPGNQISSKEKGDLRRNKMMKDEWKNVEICWVTRCWGYKTHTLSKYRKRGSRGCRFLHHQKSEQKNITKVCFEMWIPFKTAFQAFIGSYIHLKHKPLKKAK